MELDVAAAVAEILPDSAGSTDDSDTRVPVVVGRALRASKEHPGVHALVLVDQLVAAPIQVEPADERLPDLGTLDDLDGELLQLFKERRPSCGTRLSNDESVGMSSVNAHISL